MDGFEAVLAHPVVHCLRVPADALPDRSKGQSELQEGCERVSIHSLRISYTADGKPNVCSQL